MNKEMKVSVLFFIFAFVFSSCSNQNVNFHEEYLSSNKLFFMESIKTENIIDFDVYEIDEHLFDWKSIIDYLVVQDGNAVSIDWNEFHEVSTKDFTDNKIYYSSILDLPEKCFDKYFDIYRESCKEKNYSRYKEGLSVYNRNTYVRTLKTKGLFCKTYYEVLFFCGDEKIVLYDFIFYPSRFKDKSEEYMMDYIFEAMGE